MSLPVTSPYSGRKIAIFVVAFFGVTFVMQRVLRYIWQNVVSFDYPYYWPISVFNLRTPDLGSVLVMGAVAAMSFVVWRFLETRGYELRSVILAAVLLIMGSTLVQGIEIGFYAPVAADARNGSVVTNSLDGQEYYHDALKIADPIDLFRRYNELQAGLSMHSHTHPPGPLLTYWSLTKLLGSPALISIAIMLIGMIGTLYFFYKILITTVSAEASRYTVFLLSLVPAIQIYYLSSIDAIVSALLTGVLYHFCFGKGRYSAAAAAAMLTGSFLLTFVSLFILPVLVGYDVLARRSLRRSVVLLGGVVLMHGVFYAFGYDAFDSFRTASRHENAEGFMLLVDPANYFFTRLEDIAEIIFFLGPMMLLLAWRGLRGISQTPLLMLTWLACLTMLAMFATGAWRTGETARACLYLYPYLMFPVAGYLDAHPPTAIQRLLISSVVFMPVLGMQLVGYFHW